MEGSGGGILGRVGERILSWIGLALIVALGFAIYEMDRGTRQAIWDGIWKTIVWIAIVAALPWSSRLFIRRLLEIGSNWAGVILIAAFVVIDAAVGAAFLGGWPSGGWGWLAALTALAIAGTYNFLVAEYLSEQAGL